MSDVLPLAPAAPTASPVPRALPRMLVVLDVDSTLIEDEAIELLAAEAGSLDEVAAVTERAMRGELDFAESLSSRVATLAGLPSSVHAAVGARIRVTPGAERMIAGLHDAGHIVAVVSGGFHELLDPLAERLGLDLWRANRLETADGRLTGRVTGPVIDAAAKRAAVEEWSAGLGIPLARVVAIGDGANDLEMMGVAGLSVAFDAKPAVRRRADVCVDRRDLAQVLALLGLPR
ncbi:phosphoserine phosphatase SerB [Clavibacter nebraskensis]|uniref:phosphoserine phosphatase SerB n=1 Tax=Clavibacter nebraskensis TaxID=31963 RepID=UPI00200E338A|nr:phosphoserine phosphatase SerB [Clavibacter nebraskensis]UQB15237.1 phosphoserine phosphatase SerB [Clavibacter nebraskensis]